MIRLIDLPGAMQLHSRLGLLPHLIPSNDDRSRELLGKVLGALGFKLDMWGTMELPPLLPHEEPIDVDCYRQFDGGSETAFWRRRGWDIADEKGQRVRFLDEVLTAMIIIEEGRAGHSKVGLEARLWAEERATSSRPAALAQNRAFLSLGDRRRKRA